MRKSLFIACVLAVGGMFVGCTNRTSGPDEVAAPPPTAVVSPGVDRFNPGLALEGSADEHLAQLRSLQLFEVGELLSYVPGEHYSCAYNLPCPGEETERALRQQEARLAGLVAIAEDVRASEELPAVAMESATEHLGALSRLNIVQVGELIVAEPASSPECYNLPCHSDIEAAEAENTRRAAEVAAIADLGGDL